MDATATDIRYAWLIRHWKQPRDRQSFLSLHRGARVLCRLAVMASQSFDDLSTVLRASVLSTQRQRLCYETLNDRQGGPLHLSLKLRCSQPRRIHVQRTYMVGTVCVPNNPELKVEWV